MSKAGPKQSFIIESRTSLGAESADETPAKNISRASLRSPATVAVLSSGYGQIPATFSSYSAGVPLKTKMFRTLFREAMPDRVGVGRSGGHPQDIEALEAELVGETGDDIAPFGDVAHLARRGFPVPGPRRADDARPSPDEAIE